MKSISFQRVCYLSLLLLASGTFLLSAGDLAGEKGVSEEDSQETLRKSQKSVRDMRHEARDLREEADDLNRFAGRLEDEVQDIEENIDNLIQKAGLLKDNRELLTKLSDEYADTAESGAEDSIGVYLDRHSMLIKKLREHIQIMAEKSKDIAVNIRLMQEKAQDRKDAADLLEERVESLKEQIDTLPYQLRFPWSIDLSARYSAAGPYDDSEPHVLVKGGLGISYFINEWFSVNFDNVMFYLNETVHGTRSTISFSPGACVSYFPIRQIETGTGLGAEIDIHSGGTKDASGGLIVYAKLFSSIWAVPRFSFGPVFRINYAAAGEAAALVFPLRQVGFLPEGALWSELGLIFSYHF